MNSYRAESLAKAGIGLICPICDADMADTSLMSGDACNECGGQPLQWMKRSGSQKWGVLNAAEISDLKAILASVSERGDRGGLPHDAPGGKPPESKPAGGPTSPNGGNLGLPRILESKALVFALVCGVATFLGSLIGARTGSIVGWDAVIGLFLGVGVAVSQGWYMRQLVLGNPIYLKMAGRGLLAGAIGGIIFALCKSLLQPGLIAVFITWTAESVVIAYLLAPAIPNLPTKSAIAAGIFAGVLGVIAMNSIAPFVLTPSESASRGIVALGDLFKGLCLGVMLPLAERLVRSASLLVKWTPHQESRVLLGSEPIRIGKARGCQVLIREPAVLDVEATVTQAGADIVVDDHRNNRKRNVTVGDTFRIGSVNLEVVEA